MVGMGIREDARGTWFFVGVGALIGVVLGILVSLTTDVPLAPEAGVILGALVGMALSPGWHLARVVTMGRWPTARVRADLTRRLSVKVEDALGAREFG
jgi:hypothetical protein